MTPGAAPTPGRPEGGLALPLAPSVPSLPFRTNARVCAISPRPAPLQTTRQGPHLSPWRPTARRQPRGWPGVGSGATGGQSHPPAKRETLVEGGDDCGVDPGVAQSRSLNQRNPARLPGCSVAGCRPQGRRAPPPPACPRLAQRRTARHPPTSRRRRRRRSGVAPPATVSMTSKPWGPQDPQTPISPPSRPSDSTPSRRPPHPKGQRWEGRTSSPAGREWARRRGGCFRRRRR